MSQLAVLHKCPDLVSSILKRSGSLLLAAKILVLSRHLHKKTASTESASAFVEKVRVRLGKLRRKLLLLIDRRMANLDLDSEDLVDAICAFSLITSSSCADALRHFHYIRLNAISSGFQQENLSKLDAVRCLQVWTRTMQDTQALFPRQVSNALARLKSRPLLNDGTLRAVDDLDLDVHEIWMDGDIKNFTPYVRHDNLNVSTAAQSLSIWSPAALEACVGGLKTVLTSMYSFQEVLELRRDCLSLWLNSKGRLIGVTKSEGLDLLRSAFRERLQALLRAQSQNCREVISAVHKAIEGWPNQRHFGIAPTWWDHNLVKLDLSHGAMSLTNALRSRQHGRSQLVSQIMNVYESWLQGLNTIKRAITSMKSEKWEIEDFDGEEDFDDIDDIKYRLEKEDSMELVQGHQHCSEGAMRDLQAGIVLEKDGLGEDEFSIVKAAFLLRITRELKQQLPEGVNATDVEFAYVQQLHRIACVPIVQRVLQGHQKAMQKAALRVTIAGRRLWDGDPELPIIPSPWSYRLLNALHHGLSELGEDIWTKKAMDELKSCFRKLLVDEFEQMKEFEVDIENRLQPSELGKADSAINGDSQALGHEEGSGDNRDSQRNGKIQLLFDLQYLNAASLASEPVPGDSLDTYCAHLLSMLELPTSSAGQIQVSSRDYWKRTSLLFALLAQK